MPQEPRSRPSVTTKITPEDVTTRVVIASSDCGFAQGPIARRVHPTVQWAKLGALVEGACLASTRV